MKELQEILEKVKVRVTPSEEVREKLMKFSEKLLEEAKRVCANENVEPLLAGSLVRDTWLPDKKEVDLFLLFPEDVSREELEKKGLELGKRIIKGLGGKYSIEYAEHPYIKGFFGKFSADIVPCYKVKSAEEIKSAVDRSPFHLKYLKEKLNKKLVTEVRILKKFLKANRLYGADAKVQGFSGYACELLVLHYRSFLGVLKAAVKWKPGEIIDMESFYKEEDYKLLRELFKNQCLILIDPTDRRRNVTAALSCENFFRFKKLANDFLKKPSMEFFFPRSRKIKVSEIEKLIKRRGTKFVGIMFKPPNIVPDIFWPQIRRFAKRLKSMCKEKPDRFPVLGSFNYSDEKNLALVVLELEVWELPPIQKRKGPLVFDISDSKRFIEKYKGNAVNGPFVEENRWVVVVERKYKRIKEKLEDKLRKSEEELVEEGVPSYIAKCLVEGFKILDTKGLIKLASKNEEFSKEFYRYLNKESLV